MTVRIATVAILLGFSLPFASLDGRVVDQTGNAISGVTVVLQSTDQSVVTNTSGEYSFSTSQITEASSKCGL